MSVSIALMFTGLVVLVFGLAWGFFKDSPNMPSLGPVIVMGLGAAAIIAGAWTGVSW